MHYFYILYSLKDNRLYKGYSSDIQKRLAKHNAGGTPSTKHRRPFVLIYFEEYSTKKEALDRERWAKSLEGGTELKKILKVQKVLNENNLFIGKPIE